MSDARLPFAKKKFLEIKGRRMAYIDEGKGAPIVFQHGNPTSSYLWRNVMPYCRGLGRLIACDLIGMGDSEKLPDSGRTATHMWSSAAFSSRFGRNSGFDKEVILVLHDWGSMLGFDWANQNRDRVQGIAYMEAIPMPFQWSEFAEQVRDIFRGFRSPAGEGMILEENMFVEGLIPGAVLRQLSEEEMAEYRRPFLNSGEGRRPTLTFPRQVPLDGEPAEVVKIVNDYGHWLKESPAPRLWIHGDPGAVESESIQAFYRTWPNQTEVTVKG
jgi:haloalkane dehalogenase